MTSSQVFRPQWASAPGETIADVLSERGISVEDFAKAIDETPPAVTRLLSGQTPITLGLARRLSYALGASVEFWMSRDFQYRDDLSRLDAERWVRGLPFNDMVRLGWIPPAREVTDKIEASLAYFDVPDVDTWRDRYARVLQLAAFRASQAYEPKALAVAAWLRQGELVAEALPSEPWDPNGFRSSLPQLRSLTRQSDPAAFIPALQQSCAQNGVAVAVVRAPAGCTTSGAARFVSDDKGLVLLSARHLADDHLWFTFFHEAAHLLLHGRKALFVDSPESPPTRQEEAANQFAEEILVPTEVRAEMFKLRRDAREVIRFARRIGVSPGVVVGQLQHHGRIGRRQLNNLKRRYRWGASSNLERA